ncbi:hypothetical protein Tco_1492655 [Tanacetum coccineum]
MNYKPVVVENQSNGSTGTKACDNADKARMETIPIQTIRGGGKEVKILYHPHSRHHRPICEVIHRNKSGNPTERKDSEVSSTEEPRINQEKDDNINALVMETTLTMLMLIELPNDPNMPELKDIVYSDDDKDVGAEADINNLDTHIPISLFYTTRIHKDHLVEQIIGDIYSASNQKDDKEFDNMFGPGWIYSTGKRANWFINGCTETRQDEEALCLGIKQYGCYKDTHKRKELIMMRWMSRVLFLWDKICREVYVCQPLGFEDLDFPDKQKPRKSKKQNTEVSQPSDSTEPIADEAPSDENVTTHSNDLLLSDCKRIESCEDEGLVVDQEMHPNWGGKIVDIDANEQEVEVEKVVSTAEVTASVTTTTVDELTLAQTLIEIKATKPKAVTTAATTTTTAITRPKARGVVVQELKELQAELEKEERLAKQREEDVRIAEWDNVQAMIDLDYELAARLQAQEQEELTIEERAEEQRRKPPTNAQKRNTLSTYLKNMAGYTQNQLKSKNYDEIHKLFDKAMTRRAGDELEQEKAKKQKIDDDEAEMKKHMEIVPDDEVEIDAIPLDTKPPIIVD